MDPLSIAASVSGLITFSELLLRNLVSYSDGVSNHREDVLSLEQELKLLIGVLAGVKSTWKCLYSTTTPGIVIPLD